MKYRKLMFENFFVDRRTPFDPIPQIASISISELFKLTGYLPGRLYYSHKKIEVMDFMGGYTYEAHLSNSVEEAEKNYGIRNIYPFVFDVQKLKPIATKPSLKANIIMVPMIIENFLCCLNLELLVKLRLPLGVEPKNDKIIFQDQDYTANVKDKSLLFSSIQSIEKESENNDKICILPFIVLSGGMYDTRERFMI